MIKRKYTRYASPEEAKEARRLYMQEYQKHNAHKYREQRNQRSKERYRADAEYRERVIAVGCSRYTANPDVQKERNRRRYPAVKALVDGRVEVIKRTFDLLPEEQREEYAEWLQFLAGADSYTGLAVRHPSLDFNYIAVYADA